MIIRNWRDATPRVGHDNVVIHDVLGPRGTEGKSRTEAPLGGNWSLTRQMLQPGKVSDEHEHDAMEQVFYFTGGHGQMKLDGELHDVKEGDAVHVPPRCRHQTLNNSDRWLELLVISVGLEDG